MRVAFSVQSPSSLRNFESVVGSLSRRGHEVRILLHSPRHAEGAEVLVDRLAALECVTIEAAVHDTQRGRLGFAADVRASLDLLYFLDGRFSETYRERSFRRAPRLLQRFARSPLARSRVARRLVGLPLRVLDRLLPPDPSVRARLAGLAADVLLLTPYIGLRTIQPEYLRAARALGLPSAVCVASWDNLSSKSLIRPVPDRVLVWNEIQRREAEELHGVDPARVVVTGAQSFDQWLDREAGPRSELLARAGLQPDGPLILYVCFTPFARAANQDEVSFVRRWLAALRTDPALAGANVLVRPHPKRLESWQGVDLGPRTAVWPRDARLPTDESSKADYFDALRHSDAVIGLNSTAMLEAGLLGKPVLTVLAPEFHESQEGTLHFHYLLEAGGGLLRVSRSLADHVRQLREAVLGEDAEAAERSRRFVEAFLYPHGTSPPATERFVEAVEELSRSLPLAPE